MSNNGMLRLEIWWPAMAGKRLASGPFVQKAVPGESEWLEQGVRVLLSIWRDRRLLFQVSIVLADASRRGAKKAIESHRTDVFEGWKVEGKAKWGKVNNWPEYGRMSPQV